MPRRLSAEEFQEKHARRLKAASEDMRKGIEAVTEAPTVKAAAKQEKMKARLTAKIDDGTWASRLKGVSLEDWRTKMVRKGLPRVSGGIDEAKEKVTDFASQLLPKVYSLSDEVKKKPDLTLEDMISRMDYFIREMAKFRKK